MAEPFDREWASHSPATLLTAPLRWRKPSLVRIPGDLFGDLASDDSIDRYFAVMALCPQHIFQVLTKRAERMKEYVTHITNDWTRFSSWAAHGADIARIAGKSREAPARWPLPNVWLGISAERQQEADERIPHLLATPAAVRFVSAEPLLAPIDLTEITYARPRTLNALTGWAGFDAAGGRVGVPRLRWAIVGGESGPNARPFQIEWADSIVEQCKAAGVPCFVKQLGAAPLSNSYPLHLKSAKGGEPSEWPHSLRIREMPESRP